MYNREILETISRSLNELLEDMREEAAELPEGELYIYNKRGRQYYCQRIPAEGRRKKEHRISITGDSETVLALVRKKYLEAATVIVRNDISLLDDLLKDYVEVNEEAVMKPFYEKYPDLKSGIHYGKTDPKEWEDEYVASELFYQEDLKSVSAQGESMRSGGEMYIASRLDHFGIPYRYEAPLNIPDLRYSPDFTIMRPKDRKIFYWEHFGKVNDSDYVRRNIGKVNDYIDYGIRPWDNLIMTFNNEKGGYNGKLIDAMIECWLL